MTVAAAHACLSIRSMWGIAPFSVGILGKGCEKEEGDRDRGNDDAAPRKDGKMDGKNAGNGWRKQVDRDREERE